MAVPGHTNWRFFPSSGFGSGKKFIDKRYQAQIEVTASTAYAALFRNIRPTFYTLAIDSARSMVGIDNEDTTQNGISHVFGC